MAIYIKGMKMPESRTQLVLYPDGKAEAYTSDISQKKIGEYEVVDIPVHGRLIDADDLEVQDGWLRDSKYFAQESGHTHITFVYSNDIYNAPTVIAADEEDET